MDRSRAFKESEKFEQETETTVLDEPEKEQQKEPKYTAMVIGHGRAGFFDKVISFMKNMKTVEIEMPKPEFQPEYTLGQLICYHHREGKSLEEIAVMVNWSEEDIHAAIVECKESGTYEENANALKG